MRSFILAAAFAAAPAVMAVSGVESTFYGGNLHGGMCSFSTYTLPSHLTGVAWPGPAWDNAAHCGACIKVTGPKGNSVTAMIVDQCPECGASGSDATHLDLFQDGFAELDDISKGIIQVSYEYVDCGISSSPLTLRNKEGTSKYWFSMQVVGSDVPVKSLEVSTDGGSTWLPTVRMPYNFFEESSGFGTDSVDVRVTSESGETIVVSGVGVQAGLEKSAGKNFGGGGVSTKDTNQSAAASSPAGDEDDAAPVAAPKEEQSTETKKEEEAAEPTSEPSATAGAESGDDKSAGTESPEAAPVQEKTKERKKCKRSRRPRKY